MTEDAAQAPVAVEEAAPAEEPMPAPVPVKLEYAPVPVAPQGAFGFTVPAVPAGQVWIQSVDFGFLGAQAGLGRGLDVAVSVSGVPRNGALSLAPAVEVGWATRLADFDVRVSTGLVSLLTFPGDPAASLGFDAGGLGGGVAVQRGTVDRRIAVNLRGFWSPVAEGGGLNATADALLRLGPHWAALAGISETAVWTPEATLNAVTLGPGGRFLFGPFSADFSLHVAAAGAAGDCDDPADCSDNLVVPFPLIALRYGLGGN